MSAARVPKLIATDLDGTFLSPDGTVSADNAAAVLAAQAAGIPVLFATGRPVRWLDVVRGLPGAHPTVIASNGAVLYDLGTGEWLDRVSIEAAVGLEAVHRIKGAIPGTSVGVESGSRFGHETTYVLPAHVDPDPAWYHGPVEDLVAVEGVVKILVQHTAVTPDELLDRVRAAVGDRLTATHSTARGHGLVELSAPGVSKASMLRRVCRRLGVAARDVAAFGDMPNDVDMLTWVGMPRVVANAHPVLHRMGFPRVGPNSESGVGRAIESWLR